MNLIFWRKKKKSKSETSTLTVDPPHAKSPRWFSQAWGDTFCITSGDLSRAQAYGFGGRPRKGEILLHDMLSGKVGRFKVLEINFPGDPPDMWFCEVAFDGYHE